MLTGQNTEVRHGDMAFHVQTEDKGLENPFVESLVYLGGRVLASKRTSYADVLGEESSDAAVAGLMERQHQTMIEAIQAGQFDGQVEELSRETLVPDGAGAGAPSLDLSSMDWESSGEMLIAAAPPADTSADAGDSTRQAASQSLDEMVLDYLVTRQRGTTLRLSLVENGPLACGASTDLVFQASERPSGEPVEGASVNIRMVCSLRPPSDLASSSTDVDGRVRFSLQIPEVDDGAAALIVSASGACGTAELKYLL